jgi:hypothetical protein
MPYTCTSFSVVLLMRLLDHEEDQATLVAFNIGRDGVSHDDDDGDNGGGIAAAGGTSWGNKAGSEVVRANSLASSRCLLLGHRLTISASEAW